jgi:hypothetical protein
MFLTPLFDPSHRAKKYRQVETRTPLTTISLPIGPNQSVTQYCSFFSNLSMRNWSTSVVDMVRPNGAPNSLDMSPWVAHCHWKSFVQGRRCPTNVEETFFFSLAYDILLPRSFQKLPKNSFEVLHIWKWTLWTKWALARLIL